MNDCERLQALIDAETDPAKQAALSLEYRQHCLINGDQKPVLSGGGGTKNPKDPGQ